MTDLPNNSKSKKPRKKPKGSGRAKGTPNKSTGSFKQRVFASGFNYVEELIDLYRLKHPDTGEDMFVPSMKVEILKLILSYAEPKPAPLPPEPVATSENKPSPASNVSTSDLLSLVK